MSSYIILLPPPCTNSDLHMGHLAGAFIPGDVYARYLSDSGHNVKVVCAADQNNTYTELKSKKINQSFNYTKKFYAEKIIESLKIANVQFHSFPMTESKEHYEMVKNIIEMLTNNGFLEINQVEQLYCDKCHQYIFDTVVHGHCGHCYAEADGAICENCNSPRFNNKLINPVHIECKNKALLKLTNVLTLNVKTIKTLLINHIKTSHWDERLRLKYMEYFSKGEIENIIMTYHYEYGIKINKNLLEARSITIWFEAIWSCFTALREVYGTDLSNILAKLKDPDTHIVPFMGQDSEYYYAATFSAVLLGLGLEKIPENLSVQRFVKLNGLKFSSSRNHIITIDQLKEKFPIDIVRLYSISILKSYFSDSNDFNIEDLSKFHKKFSETKEKLLRHYNHWKTKKNENVPPENIQKVINNYHLLMNKLSFSQVYEEINNFIENILSDDLAKALNFEIACCLLMLNPIMPTMVESLGVCFYGKQWSQLSLENIVNKNMVPLFKS